MKIEFRQLFEVLSAPRYRPLNLEQLAAKLKVEKRYRHVFRRQLLRFMRRGEIMSDEGGRFRLPDKRDYITGKVRVHPRGFAFVSPDNGGEEIFLNGRQVKPLINGDRVSVVIQRRSAKGLSGRLIEILERGLKTVVGKFSVEEGVGFVSPHGKKINLGRQNVLFIPRKNWQGAQAGEMVVAEITRYPSETTPAQGKITQILGEADDPAVDLMAVIHQFSLPLQFSELSREQAANIRKKYQLTDGQWEKERKDLRGLFTVTIDGVSARDFDDAVAIEKIKTGGYRLWVSIADVSYFVPEGSALDCESRERATSVYFPDFVIPMFPEELSNDLCSLRPNENRLTMTAEIEFDEYGERQKGKIYDGVIKSRHRLTYDEVEKVIKGDQDIRNLYADAVPHLEMMQELAKKIKVRKRGRGSLDFDLPEPEVILDAQGDIESIVKSSRFDSHRLIEEFMISANETVAEFLEERNFPSIYRVHESPEAEKLISFHRLVSNMGYKLPFPKGEVDPKPYSELLTAIEGKPEEKLLNTVLLRSMKRAVYSAENIGHFGLASPCYTHFTSPIRRYPDLVIHRCLKKLSRKKKMNAEERSLIEQELATLSAHCSARERVAEEAERDLIELKKASFMQKKIGESFWGFIEGIMEHGFFVELEKYFIEGFVPVHTLMTDQFQFYPDEYLFRGRYSRKTFQLGDRLQVRVRHVDLAKRMIDFVLPEEYDEA